MARVQFRAKLLDPPIFLAATLAETSHYTLAPRDSTTEQ